MRTDSFEKTLMLGKIGGQEEKGMTEDEMAGWHHQLDGQEFEQVQILVTAMSLLFLILFLKMYAKSKQGLP